VSSSPRLIFTLAIARVVLQTLLTVQIEFISFSLLRICSPFD
jgi:hypothetical protein